jgi:predicted amidohydrolase
MSGRTPTLTIAVAQPSVVPHDVVGNAKRHAALVRRSRARVVVFPELSLTGYEFDAAPLEPPDPRLGPLVEACRDVGAVALAGAPVIGPGGGGRSIGVLAIDGTGAVVAYRKMWLGEAEAAHFVAGVEPVVRRVDGWRLGLAVCKDTGVPAHAAATMALGVDVYVAGVLESEVDRDEQPRRVQRIVGDHGVWVAIASFAGAAGEGFDRAAGESGIWRPDGSVIARAGAQVADVAVATITPPPEDG